MPENDSTPQENPILEILQVLKINVGPTLIFAGVKLKITNFAEFPTACEWLAGDLMNVHLCRIFRYHKKLQTEMQVRYCLYSAGL